MLETLGLGRLGLQSARFLPQVLSPLVSAAERGEPLKPVVEAITRLLGFDSFMYGTSLCTRPGNEEKAFVFTTLPRAWVSRYDQRAYVEVDPRLQHIFENALPFIWDQRSERGKDAPTDAFLDDAAAHGIASGVAIAVYSPCEGHVTVAFNSSKPEIDELRSYEISRNLPDLVLLGIYFHELFMKTVVERGVPPTSQGTPLSPRETSCLTLAAHGFASRHIAAELHISERTVELHFAHLRSKLGVANRQEAIAKAMAEGIIRRDQSAGIDSSESRVKERRKVYGIP